MNRERTSPSTFRWRSWLPRPIASAQHWRAVKADNKARLAALIRHQQKPRAGIRRDSALLRRCVEQVLGHGSVAASVEGPWRTGSRPLKRPGRGGLRFIPLVTRGKTTVMVTTPTEAEELATFLNYCGIDDLRA